MAEGSWKYFTRSRGLIVMRPFQSAAISRQPHLIQDRLYTHSRELFRIGLDIESSSLITIEQELNMLIIWMGKCVRRLCFGCILIQKSLRR